MGDDSYDYAAIDEVDAVSYDDPSLSYSEGPPIPMLSSEEASPAEIPRVRRHFVETWLWELLNSTG